MDSAKNQLADRLKTANNVLVTVSRNPSVDQLSALLGLTLLLNKMGKHAAAVYSGQTPSTIEFLKPEDTIEKNTDSLRDFIIALDKSKADKLRYKVENDVVRIFITPYKTSISQEDLEFSQGDFNVDVVVALGVHQQEDLDEAITTHGRILHDATVASVNVTANGGLGSINWQDPQGSSLSELVTELGQALGDTLFDKQIATALLTGIVAETERFSNEKTSSQTMSASAVLMSAGADQQLVATKLEEGKALPEPEGPSKPDAPKPPSHAGSHPADKDLKINDDGTIEIDHGSEEAPADETPSSDTSPATTVPSMELPTPQTEENAPVETPPVEPATGLSGGPKLVTEPPALGGMLTANTQPEGLDPAIDPLGLSGTPDQPMLSRTDTPAVDASQPPADQTAQPPAGPPSVDPLQSLAPIGGLPPIDQTAPTAPEPSSADGPETLSDIEASVGSPHLDATNLDAARDEVTKALGASDLSEPQQPIVALNAQPLSDTLHPTDPIPGTDQPTPTDSPQVIDPNAPPPVPPPIPFQFGNNSPQNQ